MSKKIKGGYYLKAKCIQQSEISIAPPHVREIWDWLIMKANYSDSKDSGNTFIRGEIFTSYNDIREGLKWYIGWRKVRYSRGHCETAMKWLMKAGMIKKRKTTRGLVITICNYDYYQDVNNYEVYNESYKKDTRKPQTHDTIQKEEKEKEIYKDFVFLSDSEYKKLILKYGGKRTEVLIESLNRYAHQIGAVKFKNKYKSHYHTILNWAKRDGYKEQPQEEKHELKKRDFTDSI